MKLQGLIVVFKYCNGEQEKYPEASRFFLEDAHFIEIYILSITTMICISKKRNIHGYMLYIYIMMFKSG